MKHLFYSVTAAAVILVLCSCINLGPDYKRPELGIETPSTFEFTPADTGSLVVEDRWWEIFGDGELNRYVEAAIINNWDIKLAAARVLETRARYVSVRADRFPEVGVSGLRDRRQVNGGAGNDGIIVDTYELDAPASFELDLWSKLKKASQAAWADILQEEEARRTIAQAVVAETISLYLNMEALERRLQIAEQSIKAFRDSLKFVETRYRRGLTSVLDVRQARRVLAQAETVVPQFEQELGIVQQQMSVLLGRYPETKAPRRQPEDYYKPLAPVPPGLPSDLLWQRPDLRAAEARLKSLNDQVGVAKASRLPTITLTGSYGWSSADLNKLLRTENVVWNLTAGIVQPVFTAGRLKAGQRAAEARYQQGVAEYVQTVLDAFAEVEQTLLTRELQLDRRTRELRFLEEARATQRVAENRYLRGLVIYLDVLNAQITRFQAEDSLVLVDLAIYRNRVALHRALGGGWGEPKPVEVKEDGIFFDFN
ncbi:transporter [Alkalispirochaeta odontotermitis]|nr:transporter [Alkalispirochaeta odontotermitis]CAB1081449.1 Efflux transport system, outer membrane factor (OMF) lipoprotein [Olavius algarvensis Delta 1 endosymbiont]